MARKRDIDPRLWENEQLADVSRDARLLFIACINFADDEGRLKGSARYLRAQAFRYDVDVTETMVAEWRDALIAAGVLSLHDHDGAPQLQIVDWRSLTRPERHPVRRHWDNIARRVRPTILARDGYHCALCGAPAPLEVDHIVAIAKGGSNDLANLRTLCLPCNRRKGAD